ncbi:MAG: tautomerase family protein [Bifidobacterium psychraerophilum]|jgi:hypothetical protein|uniref:tautomerase family protein n=1 Tax=Bifidobacterium psychraerophilum TaxID=218140 RepID=UPI0039E9CF29
MFRGRSAEDIERILDISYRVMLDAFGAPEGDRYQVVSQHEAYEMKILDTGLGIERSDEVLVFSLVTRPRTEEQKKVFYADLVHELHGQLGIRQEDVMVNLSVNSDADWSFGHGRAQFLTGEL